jgi:hypothetical protein
LDRERGMELVKAARAAFVALAEAGADEVIDVDSWLADSTSAP